MRSLFSSWSSSVHFTACAGLLAFFIGGEAQARPTFYRLGTLDPDGFGPSIAFGISPDGSVVVGESNSPRGLQGFYWTSAGGMHGLGDVPGGAFFSVAFAAANQGKVLCGASDDGSAGEEGTAVFWTRSLGIRKIGNLGGPTTYGQGQAITPDGRVIVGASQVESGGIDAYRATRVEGMVSIGDLPGGRELARATGISADGSIIVGYGSTSDFGFDTAFRWTAQGGMEGLPGNGFTAALAISGDGKTIVGKQGGFAARWTRAGGWENLGLIRGGLGIYYAEAVSADGAVIAGLADYNATRGTGEAFIWDPLNGMRDLNIVLRGQYGLDLGGFFILEARGMSADGKIIIGYGFNEQGQQEGFVADLR